MGYTVEKVDVWAGAIKDQPGGVAGVLAALSEAGVNLEFVVARRDKPGAGVVFVTPIQGAAQAKAAKKLGLAKAATLQSLRVEGPDKRGLGACICCALAEAGINLRGLSAASIGRRSIFHFAFDNAKDSSKAKQALKKLLA